MFSFATVSLPYIRQRFHPESGRSFCTDRTTCPEIDEDRPVRFEYIRVKTVSVR